MFRVRASAITLGAGCKLLLSTTGPLQGLFDKPGTPHEFCIRQALIILRQDGFSHYAAALERYGRELVAGVYWADTGWKNVGHYLEAGTERGLWQFPSAITDFRSYFGRSLQQARRGDWPRAAFFLGAAAHLVQDLCEPHHARAKLLGGHQQYERWVQENYPAYKADSAGIYAGGPTVQSLLTSNADVAAAFLPWVSRQADPRSYHRATAILLPRAQRTTAGLFYQFAAAIGLAARGAA